MTSCPAPPCDHGITLGRNAAAISQLKNCTLHVNQDQIRREVRSSFRLVYPIYIRDHDNTAQLCIVRAFKIVKAKDVGLAQQQREAPGASKPARNLRICERNGQFGGASERHAESGTAPGLALGASGPTFHREHRVH